MPVIYTPRCENNVNSTIQTKFVSSLVNDNISRPMCAAYILFTEWSGDITIHTTLSIKWTLEGKTKIKC